MNIDKCVKDLLPKIKKDKEYLWNHPEEEFKEIKTSEYIIKRLKEMGYKNIKTNIAKTGIVAELKGEEKGECILFRADMDAVVMNKDHEVKHTCGHDAHMTILLALAQLIINNKDKLKGSVKLLFQPAEEGKGGANPMIKEGVLEEPYVNRVFGLHVWSEIEDGKIAIKEGPIMASTDPFNITVVGKGGHAAIPEKCVDPIYIASLIVIQIQSIVTKNINPNETVVLGITGISGESTNNVIPDKVILKGICRTFNNELRKEILNRVGIISKNISESMNGDAKIEHILEFPAVVNAKEEANDIIELSKKIVGEDNVITNYKTMCSEDFSFFLQERPGSIYIYRK